jgi:hypothetical protein
MKFRGRHILVTGKNPNGLGLLDISVHVPYEGTIRLSKAVAEASRDLENAYKAKLVKIQEIEVGTVGKSMRQPAGASQRRSAPAPAAPTPPVPSGVDPALVAAVEGLRDLVVSKMTEIEEKLDNQEPPPPNEELISAIKELTAALGKQQTAPAPTAPAISLSDLQNVMQQALAQAGMKGANGVSDPSAPTFIPTNITGDSNLTGEVTPDNVSIESSSVNEAQEALRKLRQGDDE